MTQVLVTKREAEIKLDQQNFGERKMINKRKEMLLAGLDPDEVKKTMKTQREERFVFIFHDTVFERLTCIFINSGVVREGLLQYGASDECALSFIQVLTPEKDFLSKRDCKMCSTLRRRAHRIL